jgi:anti-sigma-K factor RskA
MNHQVDTNHQDWLAQADIYALGALDGDELVSFEAHLAAGCSECEQHLHQTHETLTLLPQALQPITPPPTVRERLLAQIAAEAAARQPVTRLPKWRWWGMGVSALAAAGLLVALSFKLYQTRQEVQHLQTVVASLQTTIAEREAVLQAEQRELQRANAMVATLQAELAKREETLEAERRDRDRVERVVATLQGELSELDATLRQLSAPQVRLVRLAGLPPSPGAKANLLWNPAAQVGVLLTSGLPQIPPDRVYELWAFAGKEPVPAGTFEVDEAGHAFLRLPSLPPRAKRYDKFAVTVEPAGGVLKPTGTPQLLGSL